MLRTAVFAAATLATAVNGLYFYVEPLVASDIRIPSESHSVDFTVGAPENVIQQGGSAPTNCCISWTQDVPTCWQRCTGSSYFARITPDSYSYAGDFSVDVWQSYVYELGNHNNATISVAENQNSFSCSRGGQSNICTLHGEGFNVTESVYYGGADPTGEICST